MPKPVSVFFERFRRITSAGNYIPEIDGLRFVAIFWVVAWMHLPTMMDKHLFGGRLFSSSYAYAVMLEGGQGVPLFFMISGFILALPFIKEKLLEQNKVALSRYYLRRLTRLEPPYLLALLIAFIATIVVNTYSVTDMLTHLGASAVYMHNIIYNSASPVLGLTWSLEVEVQFYILAPFLCYVFLIKNHFARRSLLLLFIIFFVWYAWYVSFTHPVVLPNFLCYFLAGLLLADLYCTKQQSGLNNRVGFISGIIIFIGLPFLVPGNSLLIFCLKFFLMFTAFYLVLFNARLRQFFSKQIITIIGGMCYSIYLLHTLIISGSLHLLKQMPIISGPVGIIFYVIILLAAVLLVSAAFYRWVEQPCMRKGWWKRAR